MPQFLGIANCCMHGFQYNQEYGQGSLNGDMHELFGRRLMPYYIILWKLLYCMHNNLHIFVCHGISLIYVRMYGMFISINQSINQSKNIL